MNNHNDDCGHTDEEHEAMKAEIMGLAGSRIKEIQDHFGDANTLFHRAIASDDPALLEDPTWSAAVNIIANYLMSKGGDIATVQTFASIIPAFVKMTLMRNEELKAERVLPAWMDGIEIDL